MENTMVMRFAKPPLPTRLRSWRTSVCGVVGASLVTLTLGCSQAVSQPAAPEPEATPAEPTRGDLVERILLTGELVAEEAELLVGPNVNIWPLVVRWMAEDGSEVAAGDPVIEFDNSQLTNNLEETRVRMISASTQLVSLQARIAGEEAQAEFDLEQSLGNLEKARLESKAARWLAPIERQRRELDLQKAELEHEEARRKLESTQESNRAEIDIQRIALEEARAEVLRSESGIDKLTLTASRDGILIVDEDRREGRAYQIGDSVWPGRTIARLPDLQTLIVEARVFDVDDGRVTAGMPVRATLDAFPDEVFTGTVREIARVARDSSRNSQRRFFFTSIDLEEIDPTRMRPGMSVKVEIERVHEDVLMVPRTSLDWGDAGARMRLAGGDWQTVTLGPCNTVMCVIEEGINESAEGTTARGAGS